MNEKDFAELAAGAALRLARRRRRATLSRCPHWAPEWEDTVDADTATAASLADPVGNPVTPPSHIRTALLARIADMPQDPTDRRRIGPLRLGERRAQPTRTAPVAEPAISPKPKQRRWTRSVFALAACLAVLVGVGIGAVALNQQLNRPRAWSLCRRSKPPEMPSRRPSSSTTAAVPQRTGRRPPGKAVLVADGLPRRPGWLDGPTNCASSMPAATRRRRRLGVDDNYSPAQGYPARRRDRRDRRADGGSPSGQPTTDPVIVIPTA